MRISVADPIGEAIEHTSRILFRPFDLVKWLTLGFCAFLAHLTEGFGGLSGPFHDDWTDRKPPTGTGDGPGNALCDESTLQSAMSWIHANLGWILAVAAVVFISAVAVSALVTWLESRGRFLFIDGVVRDRAAVVEPWHRYRKLGHSLFGFSFLMTLFAILTTVVILAIGLAIAWQDIEDRQFGAFAVCAAAVVIPLAILSWATFAVIALLLRDFVAPAMYLNNARVMPAWSIVRRDILTGRTGTIVLFYLMKTVLGLAMGIIATVVVLMTCCVGLLPYVGTVILLPLYVFSRCYSLSFLEQFGEPWRFFPDGTPQAASVGACPPPAPPAAPPTTRPD